MADILETLAAPFFAIVDFVLAAPTAATVAATAAGAAIALVLTVL